MKIEEAGARLYKNVFVCSKCKQKIKADPSKIKAKKIICRRKSCNSKDFRPIKKEKKIKV